MKLTSFLSLAGLFAFASAPFAALAADDFTPEPGYVSLFNGKDLTGWGYKTNNFDGKTASDDGRYSAADGILTVHPRVPRKLSELSTTQEFPHDFILKLEFRAGTNADSGIFIRKPQLQCRDYWVAGPYKDLKKYKPQDWNQIEIAVTNNIAFCTCNGEVLTNALPLPPTGPIGLEGDRGQMDYRRIQLKEIK
jgi:3-keto-disaccharide hydrolase